ncbi:MAG: carboxypeptidase-like regulatory domain-containing protein [Bacteroidota bacterium]
MLFYRYCLLILLLAAINPVHAQDIRQSQLNTLVDSIRSYNENRSIEKIYVQLDKPHYLSSDTIWFKAYVFDAEQLKNSIKSGLTYVEIATDSNKVVKRIMLPLVMGVTWGNIALPADEFPGGNYTFRAYTNWMRNFGEDYIFSKTFSISEPSRNSWLVNSKLNLSANDGKDLLGVELQFRDLEQSAVGLRQMRFRVMDGKRTVYRADKETSLYGDVTLQFNLPDKADPNSLSVVAEDLRKGQGNRKLIIPIPLNRSKNIDLQFMPEGGQLVAGLSAVIGFKAISEDGKGVNISGTIHDSKAQQVADFSGSHKGMGTFNLTPVAGEIYTARIDLPDGSRIEYPLPLVKNSGTVLKVVNRLNTEHVDILIQASPDLLGENTFYKVVAQNNGALYYAASVLLRQPVTRVRMDKKLFVSGASRITLLNELNIPRNERMVFINRQDNFNIKLSPNKVSYTSRDSVSLEVHVLDQTGTPVVGSFSLAVTDDNHVKKDTINSSNILSSMLITSGLKGTIEEEGYYLNSPDSLEAWNHLDILLMTQGWTAFSWPEVFTAKKPMLYAPESEFIVKGRVTNIFNKGVANAQLVLLSKKPFLVIDTLTDASGRFSFDKLPFADTAVYLIQSRNKRGASFNVGIQVDEFVPPVFTPFKDRFTPWYINSDTIFLKATKSIIKEQNRYDAPAGVNVLDEVVVTAKKIIPNSKNKNGAGNADYILDEQEMLAAKKLTLFELLGKRFPGFKRTTGRMLKEENDSIRYILLNSVVNLIIDGVNVRAIGSEESIYMDYLTAEDITGIEIMKTSKYGLSYDNNFILKQVGCMRCPPPPVYVELTTRSGNGAFMRKTPGVYLYKPLPYSFPLTFYRPRYPVKEAKPALADLRSTIHWEPNIITDKNGKARISFYTADQPGTYTIIVEGANMNGGLGYGSGKLKITDN